MKTRKRWGIGIVVIIVLAGMAALWVMSGIWMEEGKGPAADGTNAYAIVLGAKVNGETPSLSLRYRLEKAADYADRHPHVSLILSGGQGPDEGIAEAEAMRRYLVEHGISEDRLLLETESTSTYENLLFSKRLLPEGVDSVTLITSDYHVARARKLAEHMGLRTDSIGAKTPRSVRAKQNIRERLALIKTYIAGR